LHHRHRLHQPHYQVPVALLPQLEARVPTIGSIGARRHPHQLGVDASSARHIVILLELDALFGVGHRLHVHHPGADVAGPVLVEVACEGSPEGEVASVPVLRDDLITCW